MVEIRSAQESGRYGEALALMDQAFVFGRGRRTSLACRMPAAFGPANAPLIFCLTDGERVESAVAVKPFTAMLDQLTATGYMVGGVATRPDSRGKGFATRLLEWVDARMKDAGADFLILWTGHDDFYKRLGWVEGNHGIFASIAMNGDAPLDPRPPSLIPARNADDFGRLERFRAGLDTVRVRAPQDHATRYLNIPLPAERVDTWMTLAPSGELLGYCVSGSEGSVCYVYEQSGSPAAWRAQMDQLCGRYRQVQVNAETADDYLRECDGRRTLALNPCAHGLVKRLSDRTSDELLRRLYVPYLDRI